MTCRNNKFTVVYQQKFFDNVAENITEIIN